MVNINNLHKMKLALRETSGKKYFLIFKKTAREGKVNLSENDRNISDDLEVCQVWFTIFSKVVSDLKIPNTHRGCSYGGELARLGGLARLGEISPFLRNSYKNIMCSYEKWASPPRWHLTWFCRDEYFPYKHAQVGQPGKVG